MKTIVSVARVDAVYFGGARGADTEALRGALHHRSQWDRPKLIVVVPDTFEKQPKETQLWTKKADEVIELKNPITKDDNFASFAIRDHYLVDIANSLVAFFSGDYSTGTGKTVRMAERDGVVVTKIPIESKNSVRRRK
jgi:hypothetical protein